MNGIENKRNGCYWGTEKPNLYIEKPVHGEKVTVWAQQWFCVEHILLCNYTRGFETSSSSNHNTYNVHNYYFYITCYL